VKGKENKRKKENRRRKRRKQEEREGERWIRIKKEKSRAKNVFWP